MKKKKELASAAARGLISGCRVPGRRCRAVVVLPFLEALSLSFSLYLRALPFCYGGGDEGKWFRLI